MVADFCGFRFEISSVDEMSFDQVGPGYLISLDITNLDSKARMIQVSFPATYVTANGEQLEQESWLKGYLPVMQNARIIGNARRKYGLIFRRQHLPRISSADSLYVEFTFPDKRKKIELRFERTAVDAGSQWGISEERVEDFDVKPTPNVASKVLTKGIERLEVFEERLGIILDKLSAKVSDDYSCLTVAGEIHLAGGKSLASNIQISATAYDRDANIVKTGSAYLEARKFSGLDVFSIALYEADIGLNAVKLRVFPKAQ